jgi:electron transfer flavoprotein alpha subunit
MADSLALRPDGTLDREVADQDMNPYCRRAVSQAVALAVATGGTATVFTLGPPQAEEVLREAIAWGASSGVHICDPAFAGSDTLATARALHAALEHEGPFDIVIAGRNTVDGDTGQVPAQLAQLLGLPFAAGVRRLALEGRTLRLELERDDGTEEVVVDMPAVLSAAERLIEPAKVDAERRRKVPTEKIRRLSAADLGPGPWGLQASPTRVGAIRVHLHDRARQVMSGETADQVREAVRILGLRGALADPGKASGEKVANSGKAAGESVADPGKASGEKVANSGKAAGESVADPGKADGDRGDGGADFRQAADGRVPSSLSDRVITVVAEPNRPQLCMELVAEASRLAALADASVAVFAPEETEPEDLGAVGADRIVHLEGRPLPEDIAHELAAWASWEHPWLIMAPGTDFGREVAGRASAALGAGLVGDAIGLSLEGDRIVAAKPAFSGSLVADVTCISPIQMVTVRPGVLDAVDPVPRDAKHEFRMLGSRSRVLVTSSTRDDDVERLAKARNVIAVGIGVDPDDYPALEPLRRLLSAELAATRKVTDRHLLPRSRQVGLTGRHIAPRLYVAVALSGKFNHMVGVRSAGTVLAINRDPDALVFEHCDVGIVADWKEALPLLVEEIDRQGAMFGSA